MAEPNKPNPKRNNLRNGLLLFGFIAVLLGGLAGAKQVFGAQPGQHCNQTDDLFTCKWGSICIGRTCYRSCSTDANCPATWHCGTTDVTVETRRTFSTDKRNDTERICFPPKDPAKSVATAALGT